ncbi:MAG: hypothetical protein HZY76_00775 [Anaerolineae bacterium]|nr:MAG: hypothetical protein HZY76_00775 [Anaerolineae bacterium]
MILDNSGGDGLRIQRAGTPPGVFNDANSNGVEIAGAQSRGVYVGQSGDDGVYIAQTGAPVGGSITSAVANGFEIARCGARCVRGQRRRRRRARLPGRRGWGQRARRLPTAC